MLLLKEQFSLKKAVRDGDVLTYYPTHDYKMLKVLKNAWNKHKFLIHFVDIFVDSNRDLIKVVSMLSNYHGVQHGFYFGFLSLYTNMLFYLAFYGGAVLALQRFSTLDNEYLIVLTPVLIGLWSTMLVNVWKRREKELSFAFDVFEEENVKVIREGYKGRMAIDEKTMKVSKLSEKRTFLAILVRFWLTN
jgi:hypothetical protein